MPSSPVKEVNIEPHVISSSSTDYLIQSFLGEGFFGKVAKCIKATTGETVAVKIMKKGLDIEAQNEVEQKVCHFFCANLKNVLEI